MKRIIYITLAALFMTGCSDFTEIKPKGRNVLDKVTDLDYLLNFDFSNNGTISIYDPLVRTTAQTAFQFNDLNILINDLYPYATNVPNLISNPVKTMNAVLVTSDESDDPDRASLAQTDVRFEKYYFIINNVANIVIGNVDKASGDAKLARQLKAEAYVLRAYMHYLLVNIYAKAYDPATAASDHGVPYVKEGNDRSEKNVKSTVAEVYENILADLKTALDLNSLPDVPMNKMRISLPFAYAVKAKVLMSMHNYPEALTAAEASLAINDAILDHKMLAPTGATALARPALTCPEDLFYATYNGSPAMQASSLEILNDYYEQGNIFIENVAFHPAGATVLGINGVKMLLNANYNVSNGGLTTVDMHLAKAECLARTGRHGDAMEIINTIRRNRIAADVYEPLAAANTAEAMAHLKKVSRIECLFTCKNFINIKRWNTEEAYKETIRRTIDGTVYELHPDSRLWIFPFPQNATNYNPNLTQNY